MMILNDTARARSQLFQLLALGFMHPDAAFHRVLVDGSYTHALVQAASSAGCAGQFAHREASGFADFEAGYIHLFQMGRGGKPVVALTAGDHKEIAWAHGPTEGRPAEGRPEFLLQYTAWYRHFGLKINEDENANELPDHLACQLEFMAWLNHLEGNAAQDEVHRRGYQRAQMDFLQRHLLPFLETLVMELRRHSEQSPCCLFHLSLAIWALAATDTMLALLASSIALVNPTETDGDTDQIAAVNLWG